MATVQEALAMALCVEVSLEISPEFLRQNHGVIGDRCEFNSWIVELCRSLADHWIQHDGEQPGDGVHLYDVAQWATDYIVNAIERKGRGEINYLPPAEQYEEAMMYFFAAAKAG